VADRLSADLPDSDTVLALDGGNSKTDVVLLTAHGEVLARARCGPFLPHLVGASAAVGSIGSAVQEVLRGTADGRAGHAIARHLGLGRSTVVRYLRHETFPERKGRGVVWVLQRADVAERFDVVLVMERGKIAEKGAFAQLKSNGGALQKLLVAA